MSFSFNTALGCMLEKALAVSIKGLATATALSTNPGAMPFAAAIDALPMPLTISPKPSSRSSF